MNGIPPGLDDQPIWTNPPPCNISQQLSKEGRVFINEIMKKAGLKMLCDKGRYLINIFLHNPTHEIKDSSEKCNLCSLLYKLKLKNTYIVPIGPRMALYMNFKTGMWKYALKVKKR